MSGQQFPWDHAKKPGNKNKNRYANIIACELTISLLCTAGSFQLYCYENWALSNESKPIARCFKHPNHSHHNVTICVLSLLHGNTESRKNLGQKFFNWVHSILTGSMNTTRSTNLFTNSCHLISTNGNAPA